MLPLAIDKFDLFILKQLFPNFKLPIDQIMEKIEKQLLKELESLSKYDLRKYLALEKTEKITNEHILTCGTAILFNFEYDELFYEIDTRLNEKLSKLQVEDDGIYQLTKYGLEIYNRIGSQSKDRIKDKIIEIQEITDLSTLKVKTIIAQEHNTNNKVILTLTQQNLRQAKFNYWEITKKPIYIKGVENEVGMFKTIFHFQFTPPPQMPTKTFTLLQFVTKNKIFGDYLLRSDDELEIYKTKSSQLEPFIPLDPSYWNYSEGLFESVRGGIHIRFDKPILGTGILLGFDNCEVISTTDEYLEQTTANLLEMKINTRNKDILDIPIAGNRILIINWSDLETQLDLERKEILKKKNAIKRGGEDAMLIRIEGPIRRKEIMVVEQENPKTFFYLEEPEIMSENF